MWGTQVKVTHDLHRNVCKGEGYIERMYSGSTCIPDALCESCLLCCSTCRLSCVDFQRLFMFLVQPLSNFEEQVAAMLTEDTVGENMSGLSSEEKSVVQIDLKEVGRSLAVFVLAV